MKSLMKVTVIMAVMMFSGGALAAVRNLGSNGGDWDGGGWFDYATSNPTVPTSEDICYSNNTGPTNPIVLAAGDTGYASDIYLAAAASAEPGDRVDIYGTLNVGKIISCAWYDYSPGSGQLTVHEGAVLNAYSLNVYNQNAAHTDYVVQNGGTVNVDYFLVTSPVSTSNKLAYSLNGGTLNLDSTSATDSDHLTINIDGGTLVMGESSWGTSLAGGVILAHGATVTATNMSSLLNVSGVGSGTITATAKPEPNAAWNESPVDGTTDVAAGNTILSWLAGQNAVSHDVYFSTSQSAVSSAERLTGDINDDGPIDITDLSILASQWLTDGSADIIDNGIVDLDDFAAVAADWGLESAFKGNQTETTFNPGLLDNNTTYYWRIDEVNASPPDSPGTVWSFTTKSAPPTKATNPYPANGGTNLWVNTDLSWTAGIDAMSHDVYFGTDPEALADKGNQPGTSYDPGPLADNTTYYWRIDEVNDDGTTAGTVWNFTTSPPRLTPEEFPILSWDIQTQVDWPLATWNDPTVYQTIYDCGFNLAGFVNGAYLDHVSNAGLKTIVFDFFNWYVAYDNETLPWATIQQRVANAVSAYGSHPATFGYCLRDEPGADLYPKLAEWVQAFLAADPGKLAYINLFPNYANPVTQLEASSYQQYVDSYISTVQNNFISYDNYALTSSSYWSNLDTIRTAAKNAGIPFWNIVSSVKNGGGATPSPATLRFYLYTSLAYGVDGISWFDYFTPNYVGSTYELAPIDIDGYTKTATWYYLQDVNMALHRIGHIYITLTNVNVFHEPTVPSGCRNILTSSYVSLLSGGDYCVGEFSDAASTPYLIVTNKSLTSNASLYITLKSAYQGTIYYVNSSTGQLQLFTQGQTLLPGEGLLLKVVQ